MANPAPSPGPRVPQAANPAASRLPSRSSARPGAGRGGAARTAAIGRVAKLWQNSDQRAARTRARTRVIERRYRQTVRRIDLWSVLKLSICFYLTAMLVTLGAGIVLWWIATQLGVIEGVEDFMGELLSSDDFRFLSWRILRGATLIGLVLVCLMTVLTVLAAAFYNLFAEVIGGVELTVSEEENPQR